MNQRENFFAMLNGEKPEFVPIVMEVYKLGIFGTGATDQPYTTGKDPFGINWIATKEGSIPEPNNYMFEDIADWKQFVKIPDVDSLGLEKIAKTEMAGFNREEQIVNVYLFVGLFERMVAFMGFENTLCALIEEPDTCREFFDVIADYKIACINKMIDYYQPDILTYFDDLATANGLFMSPAVYRSVIKPAHSRILAAIAARGVIPAQHTCGKCEKIIEDFIEMGAKIWNSAQIMNDLDGIMEKYKGRLIVEGGWDSSGPASYTNSTAEEVAAEAVRCAKQYGPKGNYICMPNFINENGHVLAVGDPRLGLMMEAWHKVDKL